MPNPAALLETREARIRHDGRDTWTPHGVSICVHPGEVLLVLGPSGCGKSSLTLAINGLIPQSISAVVEGDIRVNGQDCALTRVARLSEQVGMVFQDSDAHTVTTTVFDEVCFGTENLLLSIPEVCSRAETALRTVGLWERRRDNPLTLSGGGRQRLAIACALALRPPLLVFDEPTAHLDPVAVDEFYSTLSSLIVTDPGIGIVLVEHNLDQAMEVATHVLVLDEGGEPFAFGPVQDVLQRAADVNELGVWLPAATRFGLTLRASGVALPALPLTTTQLESTVTRLAQTNPDALAQAMRATMPRRRRPPINDTTHPRAVTMQNVTVRRGGRAVLRNISLEIDQGACVALMGVNGAGKSTLLHTIAGLERPDQGRVRAQDSGCVFQNPEHQFVRATVADELAFSLRHRRGIDVTERVDAMLDLLGLWAHRDAHPFLLSGGQKRRLSLGTALIEEHALLVVDEPTFGQDHAHARRLLDTLTSLNETGITIIMATHDHDAVARCAQSVVLLSDGSIVAHAPTDDVLANETLMGSAGLRCAPLQRMLTTLTEPHS